MKLRNLLMIALMATEMLVFSGSSFADEGAQAFVEREHFKMMSLLKQPPSVTRDGLISKELDSLVDYDELTRRAFGQPCPSVMPNCANHWAELSGDQKTEVRDLLKRLVEKNYRKNLMKTVDYEVVYKGTKEQTGDARIRTEAKSKLKPRDPAVQVDYVVRGAGGNYRIVDIVTEGSSLTKNYYDQFHKMLTNPAQGYPHIVKKLNEKIAK